MRKRFSGFLITTAALTGCYLFGDPSAFPSYAMTLGLAFSVYVGGQSATDWKGGTRTPTGRVE